MMNWYKKAQNIELPVYHGSDEKIHIFNPQKQMSGYYPGFYVTIDPSLAQTYGNFVNEFRLDPSKYYEIANNLAAQELKNNAKKDGYNTTMGSGYGESEYLKKLGYQGIKKSKIYIVFDPQTSLKIVPTNQEVSNELV